MILYFCVLSFTFWSKQSVKVETKCKSGMNELIQLKKSTKFDIGFKWTCEDTIQ